MTPFPTSPSDLVPVGRAPLIGNVVSFDEPRGIGMVECGPDRTVPFHCSAITDGSRKIEVGAVVAVRIVAGRLGVLEARSVRPLPGVVSPGGSLAADQRDRHDPGSAPPSSAPSWPGSAPSWPESRASESRASESRPVEVPGRTGDSSSVPSS